MTADDLAAGLSMLGMLAGAMTIPKGWPRSVLLAATLGFWMLFVFGNSLFYGFYRGYMNIGTLTMAETVLEASRSFKIRSWWPLWAGLPLAAGAGVGLVRAKHELGTWTGAMAVLISLAVVFGSLWHFRKHPEQAMGVTNLNPVIGLGRSIVERIVPEAWGAPETRPIAEIIAELLPLGPGESRPEPRYPLYKAIEQWREPSSLNVLLVVLESVRASEMGLYGAEHSVTPFLDGLAAQGMVAAQHYSTTTQTIRAEVALHCGIPDHLGGAPWSMMGAKLGTRCLPRILRDHGYDTYWFHGYSTSFFSRKRFLPSIGIDHLRGKEALEAKGLVDGVGWGIPDREVLIHAVEALEKVEPPFYAEVMTLSNHFPFDAKWDLPIPKELEGEGLWAAYRRGIYYTDASLARFWERFEVSPLKANTIVVFVGDHGIWTFDPGVALDDLKRSEQFYRVPFIAVGPGVPAGVIRDPSSHHDFAPTVLSWLGLAESHSFIGRVLGANNSTASLIPLAGEELVGLRFGNIRCYLTDKTCHRETYPMCGPGHDPARTVEKMQCVELLGDPLSNRATTAPTEWSPKEAMTLLRWVDRKSTGDFGLEPNRGR